MNEEKDKHIAKLVSDINKKYGEQAIVKLDQQVSKLENVIPSGSLLLDEALGIGGYPLGRIVEIYGPEMSGKSTLALLAIASANRLGKKAIYIDAENALDIQYAKQLGVNTDNLYVNQPDYGEQALDITEELAEAGAFDVMVIDSVPALIPKAEIEGSIEDQRIGEQARMMSKALRKLTNPIARNNILLILINQIRFKIGGNPYQNPETTPGGVALKFYATIRIEVRRGSQIKVGNDVIGHIMNCKIQKNKLAIPFQRAQIELIYGKGIDHFAELFTAAIMKKIIQQNGPWYVYKEEKFKGREALINRLREDHNFLLEIENQLRNG